ncbi:MAG: hypothetical protein AAF916_11475 [Planctomycetota bacterium]
MPRFDLPTRSLRCTGRVRDWLWLAVLLGVAAALPASLSGCVSQRTGLEIPASAYVVGGGLVIEYRAMADGILFLVDQRRLVASQTIETGEVYTVNGSVEVGDGTTFDLIEARLYFLPHDALPGAASSDAADPVASPAQPTLQELEDALGAQPPDDDPSTPAVADAPTP